MASPVLLSSLSTTTLNSKTPTAPVKFSGFPFSGNGFTTIVFEGVAMTLLAVSY